MQPHLVDLYLQYHRRELAESRRHRPYWLDDAAAKQHETGLRRTVGLGLVRLGAMIAGSPANVPVTARG
jgi:hypothetical protein